MVINQSVIDEIRKRHALTIFCNPRGVFLHIHLDDQQSSPDIEKKFDSMNDLVIWLTTWDKSP